MSQPLYEVRQERDSTWTVLSTRTGQPATARGKPRVGLSALQAGMAMDTLNELAKEMRVAERLGLAQARRR